MYSAQERLIAAHGGMAGVRDRGMLESAMARPQHLASYGGPDAAELAAAYAFGLVRNHGFLDGNKRVGWLVAEIFLVRNGFVFVCDAPTLIFQMETLAAGGVDQSQLADWIRARIEKG